MFEVEGVSHRPAEVDTAGSDDVRSSAEDDAVERLAALAPGAQLAGAIERLLSGLLVPAGPADVGPAVAPATVADAVQVPVPADTAHALGESAGTTNIAGTTNTTGTMSTVGATNTAGKPGDASSAVLFSGTSHPAERSLIREAGAHIVDWGVGGPADAIAAMGAEVLSELVAACHRLATWAGWAEAMAAACLARSPEMNAGAAPWSPGGETPPFVTEEENRFTTCGEIACRLGVSRMRAAHLLDRGQALLRPELSPTETLHRAGLLDESKTALIVRRLEDTPIETTKAVQCEVLPRAAHRTSPQLARDIDRALTALDPGGASARRKRNVSKRNVTRPREAGEGVHEMRLTLPTMDAFLLDATLDAVAASARAAGDQRTCSQLRADAVTSITLNTLRASQETACRSTNASWNQAPDPTGTNTTAPDPTGTDPVAPGSTPPDSTSPDSTSPASTTPGANHGPGARPSRPGTAARPDGEYWGGDRDPLGADPVALTAPTCPGTRLLPDGVPLEGLLTALSDVVGSTRPWWTPSGTQPVPLTPGLSVNVDVTVPLDQLTQVLNVPEHTPPGTTDPPVGTSAPSTDGLGLPTASVTIGRQSAPVPATTALALAAGGTWRRLVTDPLTGTVLDVGRTRYRPPVALGDLVRARDAACTHPGCTTPAPRCDLDHITPWAAGGTTSLDNLTTLCEAHHRLKHTPGWGLTRANDGTLTWRTPSGARYQRDADGSITMLPRRIGPRQLSQPGRLVPQRLADAVDSAVVARLERGLQHAAHHDGARELSTRGPRPGQRAGAFEPAPYPQALHALGLTPLLDEVPPF